MQRDQTFSDTCVIQDACASSMASEHKGPVLLPVKPRDEQDVSHVSHVVILQTAQY